MIDKSLILKEAQKYLAKGAFDKAISELDKLVKESPDGNTYNMIGDIYLKKGSQKSAIEYYQKAAIFFRAEGFSQKAQALCKKILNIQPANTDALIVFGEICEERGMLAEAIKYYLVVADILTKEGRKDEILDVYSKILSLSPANIPLRVKVADIYLREGLKSDAASEFTHIARIHDEKGDIQKAREFFLKALETEPLNKEAALGLSRVYEQTGQLQQAVEQMKDAIVLFPGDIDILFRCTDLALISDNKGLCEKCLKRIAEIEPNNIKARSMLGELYLKSDKPELAWSQYLPILDEFLLKQNAEDAIGFLNTFRAIEPFETGKRLVSLYRQQNEDDLAVAELISIGDLYSEKGLEDDARACYTEAQGIDPSNPEVIQRLSVPEPELMMPESAAQHEPTGQIEIPDMEIEREMSSTPDMDIFTQSDFFTDEVELDPNLLETPAETIKEQFEPKDDDKTKPEGITLRAEKALDEVITEADIFFRYGLLNEAQRLLEELKQRFPEDINVHIRLKSVYADTHNRQALVTECLILNELYKRMGDETNAEQVLKEALDLSPEDPRLARMDAAPHAEKPSITAGGPAGIGETVSSEEPDIEDYEEEIAEADFYSRQGLVTEAISILEKLLKLFPENEDIRERLVSLGQTDLSAEFDEAAGAEDLHGSLEMPELIRDLDELTLHETAETGEDSAMPGRSSQQETDDRLDRNEMFAAFEEAEETAPIQTEKTPADESISTGAEPPGGTAFETFNFSADDLVDAQELPEPALDNDVLEIFQEFKKGLEKELENEDSETHYNLGIAYKEMGLIDDAIKEFQTSRDDPARFIQSSSMLGVCYMEKGLYSLAVDVLKRARDDIREKDDSYWALTYDLAVAYEKNGSLEEALDLFTGVYGWNAKFRDVSDKMSQLRAKLTLNVEKEQVKEKPKERKDRVSYL